MIRLPVADPGIPDTRSPTRLLLWVARFQVRTLVAGVLFGIAWMVAQALMPFAIGRAHPGRHRRPRQPRPRLLDARPARPRRDPGRRGRDAPPLRRLQLAAGLVQARAGRRAPRRPSRPRHPQQALHGRGRRHGLERRDARRRRLRHHRPAGRRRRRVLRRCLHPAVGVRRPRAHRPGRRARARHPARHGHQAPPGATARAARGGRAS